MTRRGQGTVTTLRTLDAEIISSCNGEGCSVLAKLRSPQRGLTGEHGTLTTWLLTLLLLVSDDTRSVYSVQVKQPYSHKER